MAGYFSPKDPAGRRHLIITASTLAVFVLIGVAAILLWDYSNSMSFCASTCHTMPPEAEAQARSAHARVTCVECHIGRVSTPRAIQLKLTHGRHLTNLIFNSYERPIFIKTLRPTRVTCEECHWPEQFHEDRVVELRHFLPDAVNTEKDTYLIMYTGGGVSAQGQGRGIHWHIENKVYYIADNKDLRQAIPWVQVVAADGTITEYVDVASQLSQSDIQKATKYLMDCNDCHSRTAHLFLPPDEEIDAEMAAGRIDPGIPSIKAQLSKVLNATYKTTAEGESAIRALVGLYKTTYADYYGKNKKLVDDAIEDAVQVFNVTYFPNLSTGWQSHPDNVGHKDFPGCFRCHDGQHLTSSGDSIRLECNVCHSIPISYPAATPPKAAELGSLLQRAIEPENHKNSNFIRDHRFLADTSCEPCHGAVTVGTDDKTFCGNSNCHGTKWPSVNLDAAFPHPVKLDGKHTGLSCIECHLGAIKPTYVCSACHKPPADHFSGDCASCHNTSGFRESASGLLQSAPRITHTVQGRDDCLGCHAQNVRPTVPDNHKGWTNNDCQKCHKAA